MSMMDDKVKVTCYSHTETMTRGKALEKYRMCMMASDGCEKERYMKIVIQLYEGCMECTDEEE